jgi:hypothetical protein
MGRIYQGMSVLADAISLDKVDRENVLYGVASVYSNLDALRVIAESYEGRGI